MISCFESPVSEVNLSIEFVFALKESLRHLLFLLIACILAQYRASKPSMLVKPQSTNYDQRSGNTFNVFV